MSIRAIECLDKHLAQFPKYGEQIAELKKLYQERLYFELTDKAMEYAKLIEKNESSEVLIDLFDKFIRDLEAKINYFKYARMVVLVARKYKDLNEANSFLGKIRDRLGINKDSQMLLTIEIASNLLKSKQLIECGDALAKISIDIEKLSNADPLIYSEFYRTYSQYYHVRQEYEPFYQYALQYLAYTPEQAMSQEEKYDWSIKMGMAVLLGKNIYNIGELIEKDILKSLTTTSYVWMYDLLQAFNGGRIKEYYAALKQYESKINAIPELKANLRNMNVKIKILAFLELIFIKQKEERNLTFDSIAQVAEINKDEVEWLVMKAMSLGLIKGEIDQIEEIVRVSWMKPRILDTQRIQIMKETLEKWRGKVVENLKKLEDKTKEITGVQFWGQRK